MILKPINQNLNYDSIISGRDLDYVNYDKKFKMFDYILDKGLISSGHPFAINLLNDLTFYSYCFFYDDLGNRFKLTAYQDAIAQCTHDFTPMNPNRFIVYKAANQAGKSKYLDVFAIQKAFTEDNVNIILVSKSLPQSQFLLATIRHVLNNSQFKDVWRSDLGETKNTTHLTFTRDNGRITNRIICAPSGEGLLGYPVHYLLLDEADFYDESRNFFWRIALPRTNQTKGQIILFSNPNPDISRHNSLLWELWNSDMFPRKFSFGFLDAPWNTEAEYLVAKKNSPSYIFASTHDGEFPEESGSFFSHKEIQDMLQRDWDNEMPYVNQPVFISLDLGKMRDNTVLCIATTEPGASDDQLCNINIRYVNVFPLKTSYAEIALELIRIVKYYDDNCKGVSGIGYDATGQKTFGDFLTMMEHYATPVDFSRKESNKTKLYNDFKLMSEQRKLKIVYSHEIEKQLSNLDFKMTASKKYTKVESKTEAIHDDIPDSIVVMIYIAARINCIDSGLTLLNEAIDDNDADIDEYEDSLIL